MDPSYGDTVRAAANRYVKRNPEKVRASAAAYRLKISPEKKREYERSNSLWQRYKLTVREYDKMLSDQEGKCAICRRVMGDDAGVDHNHETGKVRALLCGGCNRGLGFFKENIEALLNAIQ
jgi:hypothetical protein